MALWLLFRGKMTETGLPIFASIILGATLGFAHGFQTDHVTEIASQVIRRGGGVLRSILTGAAFGIGHIFTVTLLGTAGLIISHNQPETFAQSFGQYIDGIAGLILVALGVLILRNLYRHRGLPIGHSHSHEHEPGHAHTHAHIHHLPEDDIHIREQALGIQPQGTLMQEIKGMRQQFLFGGLFAINPPPEAIALFIITIPKQGLATGLLSILGFGLGIATSMALVGLLVGGTFKLTLKQSIKWYRAAASFSGLVVIALGILFSLRAVGMDLVPDLSRLF